MDEVESISSILGDTPFSTGAEPTPPVVEPKEEPAAVETVRDDAGRFAPRPEVKPDEVKEPQLTKADVAAIIDERRKRQDAERRLAEYEKQPKQRTDIFENPEQAITERLAEHLTPLQEQVMRLQVELAKTKMPDFDDAALAFFQVAQNDPILKHQADTAPDQFAFIYREGKRIKELGDVGGDILKYREKVTAESKAEIAKRDEQIAALSAQLASIQKAQEELAAIPKSLNKLSGSAPAVTDADPEDINNIVRFKT